MKTFFWRSRQTKTLPDGQVDGPETLSPPQEGTPYS